MRIGIDARPLVYGVTGNSRYLAEVLELLLERKREHQFVFFSNKPLHPMFQYLLKKNVELNIETVNIPGPIYLNFLLPFRIKQSKVDKFWGTLQMLPFFKLPIPSFVNYHDVNFISAPDTMARWNYIQHKLLSPRTMKNADEIFCLSKNTKDEISSFNPIFADKCKIVYPGVKKQKITNTTHKFPKNFFLTVGTLEPRKNLNMLVDAFLKFKSKNPKDKHSLLLLGRRGWGTEGEALFEKLQNIKSKNPYIEFIENPPEEILREAFHRCKAFFFPSHHEGFGLPLLEAMVEDKRCVASNIPVFKEILSSRCDLYVDPKDLEGWAIAFEKLCDVPVGRIPKFKTSSWTWLETTKKIEDSLGL